jgi:hypothetical protein
MRSLLQLMTLAATLLIAAPAYAQSTTPIGKTVPDIKVSLVGEKDKDEIYLFRNLRGSVALFYFWRSTNLQSVEQLAEIERLHGKYRDKGVRFVTATVQKEDKVKEVMQDREFGIYHDRLWNATAIYDLLGARSEPYVVLIGPRSTLAWRGVPDARIEERLDDLIEYTKPPLGNAQWLNRRLQKAERFFDQRELGKAYTVARDLFRMTDEGHSIHGRAESLRARCEEAAQEWLREALQAERDKDYEKAAYIVAEIAVRFKDPDEQEQSDSHQGSRNENDQNVQHRAEFEIGRMSGDRNLKSMIRTAQEEAKARVLNDRAADLEEDEYYLDAKPLYEEVLKEYEDTDAAKEAKKRLRRIERDTGIQQKIAERRAVEEAIRWLDIADHYAGARLYAEARDKYEALIEKHPETTAARRAKERLTELPEPEQASADAEQSKTARKP